MEQSALLTHYGNLRAVIDLVMDGGMRKAALASLEALSVETEYWRPIETAPRYENVLCHYIVESGRSKILEAVWVDLVGRWVSTSGETFDKQWQPTHWMPLPLPPLRP